MDDSWLVTSQVSQKFENEYRQVSKLFIRQTDKQSTRQTTNDKRTNGQPDKPTILNHPLPKKILSPRFNPILLESFSYAKR